MPGAGEQADGPPTTGGVVTAARPGSVRRRVVLAFLAVVACLLLTAVALSLGREAFTDTLTYGLLIPGVFAGSGAAILRRHPRHRVGRLFCALALLIAVAEVAEGWGLYGFPRGLPGALLGAWLIEWLFLPESALLLAILFLFPDGRLPARGWRFALGGALVGCAVAAPGEALRPSLGDALPGGRNPFAVDSAVVEAMFLVGIVLVLLGFAAAIGCLGRRLAQARGGERKQLEWFAYAAGVLAVLAPFTVVLWYRSPLIQLVWGVAFSAVPLAAAVAILRYRLYDIDVVINRTLVYGGLLATLAVVYVGSVLTLQLVLSPLTERSDLAVAGSTLAVVAAFGPTRRRIRALVDRRFYRSRYDAARTLEAFSGRLRDELDLEALRADLREVVQEAVQPVHVTLWLPAGMRG